MAEENTEESEDKLTEDDRLLMEVKVRYEAACTHASKWRKEAKTCFAMYANDQWSQEDIAKMVEQQRTPVTFNRAAILIDAVIGYEVNNRQETRFIGRTQGDAKVNEQLSEAARFFRDQCDAEFEESDAFRDMAICGMGWTNDRLSDQDNPEYDLVRDRVDPFEMLWDPSCKKPCLADKRYVFRKKWMDKDEAKGIFPDWDGAFDPAEWLSDDDPDSEEKVKNPRNSYQGDDNNASATRDIPVLEYQYVKSEAEHELTNPMTGEKMKLNAEEWSKIDEEAKTTFPHKEVKRNVWKRCFFIGQTVVKKDKPFPKGCTYDCVTGKRDRNKGHWFGLMRSLHDTQMWSNKFLAQIMHLVNTSAKPGYDAEEGSVKDMAKFEGNAAKPGAVNIFTDGALQKGRVQRREAVPLPPDLANLLEYANKSMSDVSGVNQELLGMADREQPGVLEYQRKQSAVTLLAPLFDSFRRYRKMSARTWLYFMQNYMTDGRLIRITVDTSKQPQQGQQPMPAQPGQPQQPQAMGGQKEMNVPFTKEFFDKDVAEYDVIIDQGASSPNLKEATWAAIQPMLPLMAERMGPEEVELILEYSPMPESFMEKMRAINAQKAQQPPPPDPEVEKAKAQIQAKQQEAEIANRRSEQELVINAKKGEQDMMQSQQKHIMEMEQMREKMAFDHQAQSTNLAFKTKENEISVKAKRDESEVALMGKVAGNGKTASKLFTDTFAQLSKSLATEITKAMAEQQNQLAELISRGNSELMRAVTAEKTVEMPDGRVYTARSSYNPQSRMVN